MIIGILVHGDNHFIVRGPLPDHATAQALIRHWTIIQIGIQIGASLPIGATMPPALHEWRIISKAFREDLAWAVIVPGDRKVSQAINELLAELSARGIAIHDSSRECW